MMHLVRELVFAACEETGAQPKTFRISENREFSDQDDKPFVPGERGEIGIPHPLDLDAAIRNAWGELLADYEIIQPFPQIGRPVHHLEPEELELTEIVRFRNCQVPAATLYGSLERSRWQRGAAGDGGGYTEHFKHFPSFDTTAIISYDGIAPANFAETREIKSIFFATDQTWTKRLKINDVAPIVLSEALNIAHLISARTEG